ncbi:MAG: hypothetical protein A7316_05860 [Candidatus Altiarchaeales archaeon WOR_SM1_86-2]|nr:MAG: hypothetical protein A7316_05860 [Candidatus Altiarchaeales archaeon WOR_SM1_86-2]ODS40734.1 MAG: hypothetical protein A7315_07740 [Candidatus Altiarchaeales archaeon WOR_SM1_79]
MQTASLKLIEIKRDLPLLSEKKLDEVKDFVDFILLKSHVRKRKIIKLRGIWQNKGFEKIDIKSELKNIREESSDSILRKKI